MIRAAFFYHKCAVNLFCKYKSDELVRIGYRAEAKREVAFVKQLLRKPVRSAYHKRYCRHAVLFERRYLVAYLPTCQHFAFEVECDAISFKFGYKSFAFAGFDVLYILCR